MTLCSSAVHPLARNASSEIHKHMENGSQSQDFAPRFRALSVVLKNKVASTVRSQSGGQLLE